MQKGAGKYTSALLVNRERYRESIIMLYSMIDGS